MANNILRNLELYFPYLIKEAEEFIDTGSDEIIIKLKNGESVLYEDGEKTIRRLPSDSGNMSELEYKIEFGYRLRKIMYLKNITQEELSERTGISQSMISCYMTGRNIPSFYKIDKIAKALDCSTDEFRYIY